MVDERKIFEWAREYLLTRIENESQALKRFPDSISAKCELENAKEALEEVNERLRKLTGEGN